MHAHCDVRLPQRNSRMLNNSPHSHFNDSPKPFTPQFLSRLAPAADPYLHNDLHLRPAPDKWPGGWTAWAQQEPRNAHSHLLSILLGNTLTVPVSRSSLVLGTWQVKIWHGMGVACVDTHGMRFRVWAYFRRQQCSMTCYHQRPGKQWMSGAPT